MSNTFKVERGIKKPANGQKKSRTKYPFPTMKVGESFFVAEYGKRPTVSTAAAYYAIRNPEYKFSIARDGDGFRVWRVKA